MTGTFTRAPNLYEPRSILLKQALVSASRDKIDFGINSSGTNQGASTETQPDLDAPAGFAASYL